jgi:hypothetical protein
MTLLAACSVVTSNLGFLESALNSNGLNCSRMPFSATVLCTLFSLVTPFWALCFFCFLDCWGPIIPCSRREAFSLLSCEGGMAWLFRRAVELHESLSLIVNLIKGGRQKSCRHGSTCLRCSVTSTSFPSSSNQPLSTTNVVSPKWRRYRLPLKIGSLFLGLVLRL